MIFGENWLSNVQARGVLWEEIVEQTMNKKGSHRSQGARRGEKFAKEELKE